MHRLRTCGSLIGPPLLTKDFSSVADPDPFGSVGSVHFARIQDPVLLQVLICMRLKDMNKLRKMFYWLMAEDMESENDNVDAFYHSFFEINSFRSLIFPIFVLNLSGSASRSESVLFSKTVSGSGSRERIRIVSKWTDLDPQHGDNLKRCGPTKNHMFPIYAFIPSRFDLNCCLTLPHPQIQS